MDEKESLSEPGNNSQVDELHRRKWLDRFNKKKIVVAVIFLLLAMSIPSVVFYNHKVTEAQKINFAKDCFQLGLDLVEDFEDYQGKTFYPIKYFPQDDNQTELYNSIIKNVSDYQLLTSANLKYTGAQESSQILPVLKDKWANYLIMKSKREDIESSNPKTSEIAILVRASIYMSNNLFLYDYSRVMELSKRADRLHSDYFKKRWKNKDEAEYQASVNEFNRSLLSLRSICGKARATV